MEETIKIRNAELKDTAVIKLFRKKQSELILKGVNKLNKGIILNLLLSEYAALKNKK